MLCVLSTRAKLQCTHTYDIPPKWTLEICIDARLLALLPSSDRGGDPRVVYCLLACLPAFSHFEQFLLLIGWPGRIARAMAGLPLQRFFGQPRPLLCVGPDKLSGPLTARKGCLRLGRARSMGNMLREQAKPYYIRFRRDRQAAMMGRSESVSNY